MQSTANKLIDLLNQQGEAFISGQIISEQLKVSRSAVWKHMNALEEAGYEIEARPRVGYRIIQTSERVNEYSLKWNLQTNWLGHNIIHKKTTISTQADAHEIVKKTSGHGTVVVADEQTASVGRQQRQWVSMKDKGIWMSFILKPNIYPYEAPQLTLLTATVIADVVSKMTGLDPKIKWPNDILINDRKVAGILTEMKAEQDDVQYVIIGIGINVNQEAKDFPDHLKSRATSVRKETTKKWLIKDMIQAIFEQFEEQYDQYLLDGFANVRNKWVSYGYRLGEKICIRSAGEEWVAKFTGVAEDGALLIERQNGKTEKIYSAEIDWYGEDE